MTDQTAPVEPAAEVAPAPAVPVTDGALIAPAAVVTPAAPVRPDGLPDAYWDEVTGIKPEAAARLAELEAARQGVPETADGYVLELPEAVVGLDGKPVAFDPQDPLAQALIPALHEAGVPQAGFSKILQAYAAHEVAAARADAEAAQAFVAAEQAKLGEKHQERTAALHGQLTASLGADAAEALRSQMRSAEAVIALELLVSKLQGPAIAGAPTPGGGSSYDETIASLPVEQRIAAVRARQAG